MITGDIEALRSSPSFLVLNEKWQLIMELCHFTEEINPVWSTQSSIQQLKALSRPAMQKITSHIKDHEVFEILVHFFFKQCGFECSAPKEHGLQSLFLPHVLNSRLGSPALLMLLFCALLEEAGLKVQLVSCHQRYLLKIRLAGQWRIIDFERHGQALEADEVVSLVNQGFEFSPGRLDSSALAIVYLNQVKDQARQEKDVTTLNITHSYLMRYQPFNLRHLRERAQLSYETGDYRRAVDDIRSYFQYKPSDFTNEPLKRLYKLALRKVRSQ